MKPQSNPQIYKVQLAIRSTEENPAALVYNKDRSEMYGIESNTVSGFFEKDENRIFVYGYMKDGYLEVIKVMDEQNW